MEPTGSQPGPPEEVCNVSIKLDQSQQSYESYDESKNSTNTSLT